MLFVLDDSGPVFDLSEAGRQHFVDTALAVVRQTEQRLMDVAASEVSPEGRAVLRLANFAADLFACVQLWQWERSGEKRYLNGCLPSYIDAGDALKRRIQTSPESFLGDGPSSSELFELVASVRANSFRFSPELEAVLLMSDVDEDLLVESLAQMAFQLWERGRANPNAPQATSLVRHKQSSIPPLEAFASIPGSTITHIGINGA